MKVKYAKWSWREPKVVPLSKALEPFGYADGGKLEDVEAQTQATSAAVGCLLALLVEKGVITLDEAAKTIDAEGLIQPLDEQGEKK